MVTHLISFLLLGIFFFKESILRRFKDSNGAKNKNAPEAEKFVRQQTANFLKIAKSNNNAAFLLECLPALVFLMNMMVLFNTPKSGNPCDELRTLPDELALFSQFMAIEHAIFIFTFASICLFILLWHFMKALKVKF